MKLLKLSEHPVLSGLRENRVSTLFYTDLAQRSLHGLCYAEKLRERIKNLAGILFVSV